MNESPTTDNYVTPGKDPLPPKKKIFGYGFLYYSARALVSLGLVGLAISLAATTTFGTPDATKSALSDSGAYQKAADQFAQRATQETKQVTGSTLNNASIEASAKESISAAMVQRDSEGVIDASYRWLRGETPQLQISVDLQPYISAFTGNVADQTLSHISTLPICTTEQLQNIDVNNINIYSLPCRPPNVDLGSLKDQALAQLTGSNELLSNTKLSTDSLPKDEQGKTAIDHMSAVPQVFQLSMLLPWLFSIAIIVGVAMLFWLNFSEKRVFAKQIARSSLSAGITVLLVVALAKIFFWFMTRPNGIFQRLIEGNFSEVVLSFAQSLERVYDGKLLCFGIVYVLLGIGGLLALRFIKGKDAQNGVNISSQDASNKKDPTVR
jgi:hypothetical protein